MESHVSNPDKGGHQARFQEAYYLVRFSHSPLVARCGRLFRKHPDIDMR